MKLDSIETLFYALAFIVPGFIAHSTLLLFLPRRAEKSENLVVRFLTLSVLNYAIWSWLIFLLIETEFARRHLLLAAGIWFLIIAVSPALLGLLLAFASQRELPRRFLQQLGLRPIHTIPTSWDFKFSQTVDAKWVLVTLTDGSFVAGRFGTRSFASSDPGDRDLFLEEVWKVSDAAPWTRIDNTDGILIKASQIRYIEFWNIRG